MSSLLSNADGSLIAVASSRQVTIYEMNSKEVTSKEVRNYTLKPSLLWLDTHCLAITSGPVNPAIRLIYCDKPADCMIKLPSPACCLWKNSRDQLCAILPSMNSGVHSQILTFEKERCIQETPVGIGVYHAIYSGGYLVTLSIDQSIDIFDGDLNYLQKIPLGDQQVISVAGSQAHGLLCILVSAGDSYKIISLPVINKIKQEMPV